MNLGGHLTEVRKNFFAASHEAGSNIVVGVLFLSLHTFQVPGRGMGAGTLEHTVESESEGAVGGDNDSSEAAPAATPATETVMSWGLAGVAGVVGEL